MPRQREKICAGHGIKSVDRESLNMKFFPVLLERSRV